ncbi:DUF6011 domain-containing protein [Lentzea cavernae]|uniref:SWIM-type domain-containing protein n=1 Tax=Lentzea cavernae TaxID=2020703 RepID=A0ABQ3MRU9_9PSEU|nr:DUF6011 domain-containing protein [Lentzea cavernae]GHH57914.1 hypothetical protein GCM10017774_78420 [Lentzea cavernae]
MTATQTTTKCICGRTLRAAKSVARGYGPRCFAKIQKAAKVAPFKPAAIEKAQELIADGGILPIRGRRVFRVVSSDGAATYLAAPQACNCAAGLKSKHACYHRVAATLLAA